MNKEQANPHLELQNLVRNGELSALRHFLETIIPSLSRQDQNRLCAHGIHKCPSAPCLKKLSDLAEDSVEASQHDIFEYLWDNHLGPHHVQLSWRMLEWAATKGDINFAKSFWARDPQCFSQLSPIRFRGPPAGESQILCAVGLNHFDYADFVLAHGADINYGFSDWRIVPAIVSWRASSEDASRRIKYLVAHGASVRGTRALMIAVMQSNEYIEPLLSNGANPNEVVTNVWREKKSGQAPLIEAAAKGDLSTVKLLFAYGADINVVDGSGKSAFEAAERNMQERVVRYLQSYYLNLVIWLSRYAKRAAESQQAKRSNSGCLDFENGRRKKIFR